MTALNQYGMSLEITPQWMVSAVLGSLQGAGGVNMPFFTEMANGDEPRKFPLCFTCFYPLVAHFPVIYGWCVS